MKFVIALVLSISLAYAEGGHYKSYVPWETDSIFVAWLIKRYVDKDAVFSTIQKPEKIEKEYAINTSNSSMRRSSRFTAFEAAARIHNINNECIEKLRPIIRVLEMTPWRKHEDMRSFRFEEGIVPLFPAESGEQSLEDVFNYIDKYCEDKK
jgi:hypothetical protein